MGRPAVRVACSTWTDPAALQLWSDLLHITPPAWRAVAAVQLGLGGAYQAGDELLAGLAIEQVLAADPDDDMALLAGPRDT